MSRHETIDWHRWDGPTRPFQRGRGCYGSEPARVPEPIARMAYEEYARQHGTGQSFERLHERGGFSHGEIIALLAEALRRRDPHAGRAEGGAS